jgi:hypothetical protein
MHSDRPIWEKLGTKLKMGLQFCPEAEWLPLRDVHGVSTSRHHQIALKNNLFDTHNSDVFATTRLADEASHETLRLVKAYSKRYLNVVLPKPVDTHPLKTAARAIPEDLAIISPVKSTGTNANNWLLTAGAIAFPAHWILKDKIGKPMTTVHDPVPNYKISLDMAVNRFFNNMKPGPISCRFNWSLQYGNNLFTPHRSDRQKTDNDTEIQDIYVRIERQTLRKLPKSGHILFTIRTNLQSLGEWVETEGALASLWEMLNDLPEAYRLYKGAALYEDTIRRAANICVV